MSSSKFSSKKKSSSSRPTLGAAIAGMKEVRSSMVDVLDRTRPLSTMIGMAPISFYGTATEDVNVFIVECEKARRYNKWTKTEAVVRLAYFLDGNARYAFEAEVSDRAARKRAAAKAGTSDVPLVGSKSAGAASATTNVDDVDGAGAHGGLPAGAKVEADEGGTPCGLPTAGTSAPTNNEALAWIKVLGTTRARIQDVSTALASCVSAADLRNTERSELQRLLREAAANVTLVQEGDGDESSDRSMREAEEVRAQEQHRLTMELSAVEARLAELHKEQINHLFQRDILREAEVEQVQHLASSQQRWEAAKPKLTAEEKAADVVLGVVVVEDDDDTALAFPTFTEFCDWLRTVFEREDVTHAFMSEFYGRRQERGEKVQDFAYEVLRLSQRSGMNLTEKERSKHFLDGLTPRMRKHIKREWARGSVDSTSKWEWNALLTRARRLERDVPELSAVEDDSDDEGTRRPRGANRRHMVASAALVEDSEEEDTTASETDCLVMSIKEGAAATQKSMTDMMAAMKEMMSSCMSTAQAAAGCGTCGAANHVTAACPSRTAAPMRCYNCQELGHMSRACPRRVAQQTSRNAAGGGGRPLNMVQCYSCKQMGHYSNACPNRRPAAPRANALTCYNCNQVGHTSRTCKEPRKVSAGRQQGNGSRA